MDEGKSGIGHSWSWSVLHPRNKMLKVAHEWLKMDAFQVSSPMPKFWWANKAVVVIILEEEEGEFNRWHGNRWCE